MINTIPLHHIQLLDEAADLYNRPAFIENDPVSVPHRFFLKEDIEIAGFISAVFAWGKRSTSISKANEILQLMDDTPYDFISHSSDQEYKRFEHFVHRTFQSVDALYFINGIKSFYRKYGSLEDFFAPRLRTQDMRSTLHDFKAEFFSLPHFQRTEKHLPDPYKGSAAKRMNMFLRWMIRDDHRGVDFGIWRDIDPAILKLPLDVHSGRVARKLGLLMRKQNDWKAVEEVSSSLSLINPKDPIVYDFALFGLGVNKIY